MLILNTINRLKELLLEKISNANDATFIARVLDYIKEIYLSYKSDDSLGDK